MIKFPLVAFDLDDTLYPEVAFVKSGFTAVAQYLDDLELTVGESFLQVALSLFSEGMRGKIFNFALDHLEVDYSEGLISDLVRIYREHQPHIRPFKGSAYMLQSLRKQGCIIALISDGPFRTQRNKLRALGFEESFHHIILTGAYGPEWSKPNERAFVEVMRQSRIPAYDCLYIADNPRKDFIAPNRLGWHTIRVRAKIGLYYHEISPAGGEPKETVENLTALRDHFSQR
jgi:putative hydrolase of the HAD superfamily